MKKIFIIFISILSFAFKSKIIQCGSIAAGITYSYESKAQMLFPSYMSAGPSRDDSSYTFFQFNSPSNDPLNRWEPLKVGIYITHFRTRRIFVDSVVEFPLTTIPSTAQLAVFNGRELKA